MALQPHAASCELPDEMGKVCRVICSAFENGEAWDEEALNSEMEPDPGRGAMWNNEPNSVLLALIGKKIYGGLHHSNGIRTHV